MSATITTRRPVRIQLARTAGWRKPKGAIVVSRPHDWGNPFKVGAVYLTRDADHDYPVPYDDSLEAVAQVALGVSSPALGGGQPKVVRDRAHAVALFREYVARQRDGVLAPENIRRALRGHDLCCWCPAGAPCHADVLIDLAND